MPGHLTPPVHGWRYLIALGSNMRHVRFGDPDQVVREAIGWLDGEGIGLGIAAPRIRSKPLGPSRRTYSNTVALVHSRLSPPALLKRLHAIEHAFGRRHNGCRWRARVLDLDIVLWSGGCWRTPGLDIPHTQFRSRTFVLGPACWLAPHWRDPATGLTLSHLYWRLTHARPLPKRIPPSPAPRATR